MVVIKVHKVGKVKKVIITFQGVVLMVDQEMVQNKGIVKLMRCAKHLDNVQVIN